MIVCNDISKSYGTQKVIDKFSYSFNDTGFYLLLGESGSGKTTFINILSGFTDIDGGSVVVNGKEYSKFVGNAAYEEGYEYITQDTFFVDFLTVEDNLKMITDNSSEIDNMLVEFDMCALKDKFPSNLSGGEKQRLAIIRALLSKKKVLFLDEPTASLDENNKRKIFQMLSQLKEKILIICSSHDIDAKYYADEIINFDKITEKSIVDENTTIGIDKKEKNLFMKKKSTKKNEKAFLKKWFKSSSYNKKAGFMFGCFFVIVVCIAVLADTPQNKRESNIEYLYKVNVCTANQKDNIDIYEELCNTEEIKEVVIAYEMALPLIQGSDSGAMVSGGNYEKIVYSIPYGSEHFKLSDKIKYGSYYTDINQIILSYDYALMLMPNSPEDLIGSTIPFKFYEIGTVDMEIVGIFDKLDEVEDKYFDSISMFDTEIYYINSEFTKQLLDSEEYVEEGGKTYYLYFESYRSMIDFYKENYDAYLDEGVSLYIGLRSGKNIDLFHTMHNMFFPLVIFLGVFTILFYINMIKTELVYNNKFISVFEYAGYSKKRVINALIWLNVVKLLKICMIASIVAYIITYVINYINLKYMFVDFQLFTYNIRMLSSFIVATVIIVVIAMHFNLRKIKYSDWYDNIRTQRDLL